MISFVFLDMILSKIRGSGVRAQGSGVRVKGLGLNRD
jgi:hypothetical protein